RPHPGPLHKSLEPNDETSLHHPAHSRPKPQPRHHRLPPPAERRPKRAPQPPMSAHACGERCIFVVHYTLCICCARRSSKAILLDATLDGSFGKGSEWLPKDKKRSAKAPWVSK